MRLPRPAVFGSSRNGKRVKVLLLGARGQLATALQAPLAAAGHAVVGLAHAECDITDGRQVAAQLERHGPNVVINTAAFHQVDRCEADSERAFLVNSYGPRELARHCASRGIRLLHVSTNYVFDGRQRAPYDEAAPPNPLSVYGLSKLAGEAFVLREDPRHLVVRSAGLFGRHQGRQTGENFGERMIAAAARTGGSPLRVVTDQIMTPTYTGHLAAAMVRLLEVDEGGLFHMTGSGSCSWWEFAQAIVKRAGVRAQIEAVTTAAYGAAAPRPAYSVLSSSRTERVGLAPLPSWEEGLDAYFRERTQARGADSR